MDPLERAIRSARMQRRPAGDSTARLGDMLDALLAGPLGSAHERFSALAEAWRQALPPDLREQCEIMEFTGGRLKVAVAGSARRYEMQLRMAGLLAELKRQCPAAKLKRIELVPA